MGFWGFGDPHFPAILAVCSWKTYSCTLWNFSGSGGINFWSMPNVGDGINNHGEATTMAGLSCKRGDTPSMKLTYTTYWNPSMRHTMSISSSISIHGNMQNWCTQPPQEALPIELPTPAYFRWPTMAVTSIEWYTCNGPKQTNAVFISWLTRQFSETRMFVGFPMVPGFDLQFCDSNRPRLRFRWAPRSCSRSAGSPRCRHLPQWASIISERAWDLASDISWMSWILWMNRFISWILYYMIL